uniref:Uncharacterized protein n=1 Tax=Panagrolaimus superbus TaxID=310955 RepID=A0A914YD59_9BILA
MSNRNSKKTFALLTIPANEKLLEILTFNDAEIISDNKYSGKDFMEDASNFLLDLKAKNLEGVILDFYCHNDSDFLLKIRQYFFEFCESKIILFRLVYQNVIFTSMLLYHSDLDFNPDDTVYSIWIKKDNFVSYKLEESTLYFITEMKISDDFADNEEYDKLLDCENPKFLVLGSQLSDVRLKKLKDRFKAQKTKVMFCTYEDCLKKSASHYLSRFIRAKDWRWNFKLSDSTNPKEGSLGFPRRRKTNNFLLRPWFYIPVITAVMLAIIFSLLLSNSPTELSGK